eukprot:TRINITY_DN16876_c0_g1_i1.p1 TRINITY_DN16876_c0_g1~~TRINITY_DN16876_c0_g1_i1.p1  ORF type:complete len:328 (-),score=72.82 TRINITY_DN16876_c0_g1_i1:24-908(-)
MDFTLNYINDGQWAMFGGVDNSIVRNDLWIYNKNNKDWKLAETKGNAPLGVVDQSSCLKQFGNKNDSLFLFGGSLDSGFANLTNQFSSFSPNGAYWVDISGDTGRPTARYAHSAVCSEESMIIFGGKTSTDTTADTYIFYFKSNEWRKTNVVPHPSPRMWTSAELIGEEMFLFGGYLPTGNSTNELWKLNTVNHRWSLVRPTTNKPAPRSGHASFVYQDNLYIWGGEGNEKLFSDLWVYNVKSNTWNVVSQTGNPSPLVGAKIATGEGVSLLFGGSTVKTFPRVVQNSTYAVHF